MKNLLCTLLLLIGGCLTTQAQDVSKFKALNDSAYQTTAEYQTGNKYQKDAILFMDMVADTHPYYTPSSRDEGLRLLHGLATSLATSLQTPQEA